MSRLWLGMLLALGCAPPPAEPIEYGRLDGSVPADRGPPAPEPAPQPAPEPTAQPTPEPAAQPEPAPQPTPEPTANPEPAPQPEPAANPEPEPAPAPEPEPSPQPEPEPGPAPAGTADDPIRIEALPYRDQRDTRQAPRAAWDAYSCAPDTDEGGGEFVYVLDLREEGTLTVAIDEQPGDGIDVDVHLLDAARPDACLARDHARVSRLVPPGRYFIAIDTWVDAAGAAQAGPYQLDVTFRPRGDDRCQTRSEDIRMAWQACAPTNGCCVEIGGARYARLPCAGEVVKEAHLVTVDDDGFAGDWPSASRDGLAAHYALSAAATGYQMDRREAWAPEGEGGSRWGQSAYSRPLPVIEEAWYVNMFWSPRPAAGTRIIVRNPVNGRAVVGAGGYETGPGSNTRLGGVTEEIHHVLGTNHGSVLEIGFAVDQTLPFGPIDCD